MSFRIGDKVVCVDDTNQGNESISGGEKIRKGKVYVVRDSVELPEQGHGVRLVGVYGGKWIGYGPGFGEEAAWRASRFRLVSEVGHPPIQLARDCGVDNGAVVS